MSYQTQKEYWIRKARSFLQEYEELCLKYRAAIDINTSTGSMKLTDYTEEHYLDIVWAPDDIFPSQIYLLDASNSPSIKIIEIIDETKLLK